MYSMHAVLVDAALGAARIGRDLMLAGHRKFAAVEGAGGQHLLDADGSAILIHAMADDHAAQPIGGSGDRVACGVVAAG